MHCFEGRAARASLNLDRDTQLEDPFQKDPDGNRLLFNRARSAVHMPCLLQSLCNFEKSHELISSITSPVLTRSSLLSRLGKKQN